MSTGVNGVTAKRQGDHITVRVSVTGNGGNVYLGKLPSSILQGATVMEEIKHVSCWEVVLTNDKHVQINTDAAMYLLSTASGKTYKTSFDITL